MFFRIFSNQKKKPNVKYIVIVIKSSSLKYWIKHKFQQNLRIYLKNNFRFKTNKNWKYWVSQKYL